MRALVTRLRRTVLAVPPNSSHAPSPVTLARHPSPDSRQRPLVTGTLAQYKKTFDQMAATMNDMVTPNRESSTSIDSREEETAYGLIKSIADGAKHLTVRVTLRHVDTGAHGRRDGSRVT